MNIKSIHLTIAIVLLIPLFFGITFVNPTYAQYVGYVLLAIVATLFVAMLLYGIVFWAFKKIAFGFFGLLGFQSWMDSVWYDIDRDGITIGREDLQKNLSENTSISIKTARATTVFKQGKNGTMMVNLSSMDDGSWLNIEEHGRLLLAYSILTGDCLNQESLHHLLHRKQTKQFVSLLKMLSLAAFFIEKAIASLQLKHQTLSVTNEYKANKEQQTPNTYISETITNGEVYTEEKEKPFVLGKKAKPIVLDINRKTKPIASHTKPTTSSKKTNSQLQDMPLTAQWFSLSGLAANENKQEDSLRKAILRKTKETISSMKSRGVMLIDANGNKKLRGDFVQDLIKLSVLKHNPLTSPLPQEIAA